MPSASFAGANADTAPLSAATDRRRNLSQRILSGIVLGPLALVLAFEGGAVFDLALAAAAAVGFDEWLRIVAGRRIGVMAPAPLLVVALYLLSGLTASFAGLLVLTGLCFASLRRRAGAPLLAAAGLPYVTATALGLIWLRDSQGGGWTLLFFLLIAVWATDIGAFFIGRAIGGPRLAPRLSPNKTWAGAGGGLLAAAGVAAFWCAIIVGASRPAVGLALAIALSIASQAGDLFESAIKRRFGVKDSGALIPGHGGMLDRIDGLLFAAPVFAGAHALGLTAGLTP
jgi:phosphatidate cytidylyltransferase